MTAKKRIVINAKRNVKVAAGKAKNAQRKLSYAELQAQLAEMQEQNARQQTQIARLKGVPRLASGEENSRLATQSAPLKTGAPRKTGAPLKSGVPSAPLKTGAQRNAQSIESNVQSIESNAQSIESNVQSIESKIEQKLAELHALNSELDSALDAKTRANPDKSARLDAKAQVRANLPAPVLGDVVANGPHSITLHWGSVANASAYIVSVADNSAFEEANLFSAGPAATSWTVNGLLADTTYYVRVRANGSGEYGNSAYSASKSIATTGGSEEIPGGGEGGGENGENGGDGNGEGNGGENGGDSEVTGGVSGELQTWLAALRGVDEEFFDSLPQFGNMRLSSSERRRALGSGVRRYGYIDKVSDTAEEFPQFWPAYSTDSEKLKERIREIEVLRHLLVYFESGMRDVLDMLLTAGNDAFQLANMYYGSVRAAARQKIPNAEAVFQLLRSFWKRRRRTMAEPTKKEILRDSKALMRGTKDGNITIANKSDRIVKGKKAMIDNTFPVRQRGKVKVTEQDEELWE